MFPLSAPLPPAPSRRDSHFANRPCIAAQHQLTRCALHSRSTLTMPHPPILRPPTPTPFARSLARLPRGRLPPCPRTSPRTHAAPLPSPTRPPPRRPRSSTRPTRSAPRTTSSSARSPSRSRPSTKLARGCLVTGGWVESRGEEKRGAISKTRCRVCCQDSRGGRRRSKGERAESLWRRLIRASNVPRE